MADAHLRDFYRRVQRIRKVYRRGGGFEAQGTLSRSFFVAPPARRLPVGRILRPTLYTLVVMTLLKAAILANIGPQAYGKRLALLARGDTISRVGAALMTADPATTHAARAMNWVRTANF